jgi:hypothetical protein
MENEEILGMIPKIYDGWINYAMFLSNKRIVLIKIQGDLMIPGAIFGGVIGGLIAQKYNKDQIDFKNVDLDSLISNADKTIEIPNNKLIEIRLKKEIGVFRIIIFGLNKRNKKKKLVNYFLAPTRQQLEERVKAGEKSSDVMWEYALEQQNLIENIFGHKLTLKYK